MKLVDLDEIEYFTLVDKLGVPRYKIEIGDGLPIVEAIPIWWIDSYCTDCTISLRDNDYKAIKKLLEDWKEENE